MSEISRINMEAARFDPQREFGSPQRLVESIAMTRGQKLAALERWAQQVLDRLKASGEGMPTHRSSGEDIVLLEQVQAAIGQLRSA